MRVLLSMLRFERGALCLCIRLVPAMARLHPEERSKLLTEVNITVGAD